MPGDVDLAVRVEVLANRNEDFPMGEEVLANWNEDIPMGEGDFADELGHSASRMLHVAACVDVCADEIEHFPSGMVKIILRVSSLENRRGRVVGMCGGHVRIILMPALSVFPLGNSNSWAHFSYHEVIVS